MGLGDYVSENAILTNAKSIQGEQTATYGGIIRKTLFISIIGLIPMFYMMSLISTMTQESIEKYSTYSMIAFIGYFIGMFGSMFSRSKIFVWIMVIAYPAVMSGFFALAEMMVPGILLDALLITTVIFVIVFALFTTDALRATPAVTKVYSTLIMGVIAYYLLSFVLRIFNFDTLGTITMFGPIGILFTGVLLVIAVISLVMTFEHAKYAVESGASKDAEFHIAASLFFGLIYLYYVIVRLLLIIAEMTKD